MSQKKVDRYKQEKANRKEIMRKEKIKHTISKCGIAVVGLCLVGWLGFSGYRAYEAKQPRAMAEVNYTDVNDYLNQISGTAQ